MATFTDEQGARALVEVLGATQWEAVAIAKGFIAVLEKRTDEEAARIIYEQNQHTLKKSREIVAELRAKGFLPCLRLRERTGSAENPITKLFPAAITERRFIELIDQLCDARPSLDYHDDREVRHGLTDSTLTEGADALPINIKNAGTKFLSDYLRTGLGEIAGMS